MAKMIIEGVYAVTEDNLDTFYDLWEAENADPLIVADIIGDKAAAMVRIDHPGEPYYPNKEEEPDTEQWLWEHPKYPADPKKMMSLYVDVTPNGQGGYNEIPRLWTSGEKLTAMVVYKKSCCPQYSVLLCAVSDGEFEYKIRDDQETHTGAKNMFDGFVDHDEDGSKLAHAYAHIRNRDHQCNHAHKVNLLRYVNPRLR